MNHRKIAQYLPDLSEKIWKKDKLVIKREISDMEDAGMNDYMGLKDTKMDLSHPDSLELLKKGLRYDSLPAAKQMLTFQTLESELKAKLSIQNPNAGILETLGLLNREFGYTNAAELLSEENRFPGIEMVRYGKDDEILSRIIVEKGSVLTVFQEAETVFEMFFCPEIINGIAQEEDCLIPKKAFREVLANALIHRDWSHKDCRILIRMDDESVTVSTPYPLLHGITPEKYMQDPPFVPANHDLGYILLRLGYAAKLGSGVRQILLAYQGQERRPEFSFSNHEIAVTLPVLCPVKINAQQQTMINSMSWHILFSRKYLEEKTGFSRSKTARLIRELMDLNLVEKYGSGPSARYKRNTQPAIVRRTDPAEPAF